MTARYRRLYYLLDPAEEDERIHLGALVEHDQRVSFIKSRDLTRHADQLDTLRNQSIRQTCSLLQHTTSLDELPPAIGPYVEPGPIETLDDAQPLLAVERLLNPGTPERFDVPRFWAPRDKQPWLDADGFLYPPQHGDWWSKDIQRLQDEALDEAPALILLGEPGMGKSRALDELERRAAQPSWRLDLRDFANPKALQTGWREAKKALREDGQRLLLLLDGWDESSLDPHQRLEGLQSGLNLFAQRDVNLRIASRDASWLPEAAQMVQRWSDEDIKHLVLLPLRESDVRSAARQVGADPDAFFQAVRTARAGHLAARPVTLRMLLRLFKRDKTLPPSAADLYTQSIREQLIWPPPSFGSAEPATAHAFWPAARVAAALTLARRDALYLPHPSSTEPAPEQALAAEQLTGGQEREGNLVIPVTDTLLRSLVNTPVFSSRGPYLHGFAHKTFQEFLAASYLNTHLTPPQLLNLLTARHDKGAHIPPHLHEVAGWLATLNPSLRDSISEDNPAALLHSDDLFWNDALRAQLVDALIEQVRRLVLPWYTLPHSVLSKLKHPGLPSQLQAPLSNPHERPEVQRFVLHLIAATTCREMIPAVLDFVLAPSSTPAISHHSAAWLDVFHFPADVSQNRIAAIQWLLGFNDDGIKARLRPLALRQPASHRDDKLHGIALNALWPNHISLDELLEVLTDGDPPPYSELRSVVEQLQNASWDEQQLWKLLRALISTGNRYGNLVNTLLKRGAEQFNPDALQQFATEQSVEVQAWITAALTPPKPIDPAKGWRPTPLDPPLEIQIAPLLQEAKQASWEAMNAIEGLLAYEANGVLRWYDVAKDRKKLPGWSILSAQHRQELCDAAQALIETYEPSPLEELPLDKWYKYHRTIVRDFQLLLTERPEALDQLSNESWTIWTDAVFRHGTPELVDRLCQEITPGIWVIAIRDLLVNHARQNYIPNPGTQRRNLEKLPYLGPLHKLPQLVNALCSALNDWELPMITWGELLQALLPLREDLFQRTLDLLPTPPNPAHKGGVRASFAAQALLSFRPGEAWPTIERWLTAYPRWGARLLEAIVPDHPTFKEEPYHLTSRLSDEAVGQLMLHLHRAFPIADDPPQLDGFDTPDKQVRRWRNGLVNIATQRGAVEALQTLQHLRPQDNLASAIAAARQNRLGRTWLPTAPAELMALVNDSSKRKRIVRTPKDLLAVVIEALERLQQELTGSPASPPAWPDLWDDPDGPKPKLKKENRISDYITRQLYRMLEGRSIVINREVQVRPGKNANRPEQIDIDVTAQGAGGDTLRLFIEVKRSDHPKVKNALEHQLDAYLGGAVQAGLYLVAWADQHPTPSMSNPAQLKALLDAQAEQLQQERAPLCVRAFVLNCSMPTHTAASTSPGGA